MYAEIAVNAPLKNTFHYHIPPELAGKLRPGHLVQVAFGTALQHGIVLALHEHSDIEQTKPVLARLDPRPVLTAQQIDLAYWMHDRYLTPLGTCLWLMLPPGITGGRDILVTLRHDDHLTLDPLEQQLITLLKRRGPLRGRQIDTAKVMHGQPWRAVVEALGKGGVVEVERMLTPPRVRPKTVKTASLAINPAHIPAVARHLGKSSRRAELLEVIAATPGVEASVEQVLQAAGVGRAVLRALEDMGLVAVHRGPPATVTLEIPPESVEENLIELRNGYRQLSVLQLLAHEAQPLDVQAVYAKTGAKLTDLKRLAEDDLILLSEAHVWRDSLAERDFVPSIAPPLSAEQQAAWTPIREAIDSWVWQHAAEAPSRTPFEEDEFAEREWRTPPALWEKLKPLARQMRHEPTAAEDLLWQRLRRGQMGYPIRRQHAVGRFIVDFLCSAARLVIEVDGETRDYTPEEDAVRQDLIESLGLKVLRFSNEAVRHSLDDTVATIRGEVKRRTAMLPLSDNRGGGWGEGSAGGAFLLHGVTGSGKTEIYLRAVERTLAQGRQAIFLVPEIALTPQTVQRLLSRFPGQVGVIHSGLSEGERYDTWRRAREGLLHVVVGPRSALFTPFPDVGLVILDEEHDHSYKQSPPIGQPFYHARDVAETMMRRNQGVLILGSATPALESIFRAQHGEIHLLNLPQRIMGHRTRILEQSAREGVAARYYPAAAEEAVMIDLPPVEIVDMRRELKDGNTGIFSRALQAELAGVLKRNEQAILFLNRRGTATYVFCRDCGYVVVCPRCETPLTYHHHSEIMRCHHCGHGQDTPRVCPQCESRRIRFFGAGTQQVEDKLKEQFPQARVLRWDADTAQNPDMHDTLLRRFIDRKADVMVGTQMIAKGLDLPLVTLVGVVSADIGLALPDFRASERTFQLLTQVAGRAGRGLLGGRVILQTYQPAHYAIRAAAEHDYGGFYGEEIARREAIGYPPFRRLARIVFRFQNEARAQAEAERAAAFLRDRMQQLRMTGTELIGPAPCFFRRVNRFHRWHVLLRGPNPAVALQNLEVPPRGWYVDIDPVDVL